MMKPCRNTYRLIRRMWAWIQMSVMMLIIRVMPLSSAIKTRQVLEWAMMV
ncbi:hypothetical protein [Moraxella lacunata]